MAIFDDHIQQARKNLNFLSIINKEANEHWDWQVTTCFYTAVHLINGHLASVANLHFQNHTDTLNAISPAKSTNIIQVPENCYLAYRKLFNDSIRSRYLSVHTEDKPGDYNERVAYLTHDRHMQKAVQNLDVVIGFINEKYGLHFPIVSLDCIEMRAKTYMHFKYEQKNVPA